MSGAGESTAVRLRPARDADAPRLAGIAAAAYRGYVPRIGREPAPMGADYREAIATADVVVAIVDGAVAGYAVSRPHGPDVLLENVAVDPRWQGRGVGRALIAHVERRAVADGRARIRLYTNEAMTENLALYLRLGYTEVGRAVEEGFRRIYLVKPLTGPAT